MAQQFDINAVVTSILKDYVQTPTFEELKADISRYQYVGLRDHFVNDVKYSGRYGHVTGWYKIKHVLSEAVIVEEVLLKCGKTRFDTHVVKLSEWDKVFGEWIDSDHDHWFDCDFEYKNGMRSWGARVSSQEM